MTLELFSTSVPAGLEPGRSGFCTVAMTRGLSRPLVDALEALSAYRPVFLPTDPRADDNPVAVSYLRVPAAGRSYHVVSRIGFAGPDYTGRSNRFAHHVVLDANDPRPPAGPAWLASRPGFLETTFDGEVRYLSAGRAVPAGAPPSAACPTWQKLAGDAGWAGVVAEALANPAARSFFLVFDLGTDVLALLREAVGLLPPERRWEATFTTYFTGLPAGVGCAVRGVLRGSAEAAQGSLDLGKLRGKTPPVNEWTAAARVGKTVATRQVAVNAPVKAGSPPSPAQLATPQPLPFADIHAPADFGFTDGPRLARERKPAGVGKWVALTVLASLVFLGGGAGAVVMLRPDLFHRKPPDADSGDEKEKAAPVEEKGKAGTGDKGEPKTPTKFAPGKATMTMDRPVAGSPALLRVNLDFPKEAPAFPLERLRFTLDGKELPAMRGDGGFVVTLPMSGPHKIVAEYAGDERFDKVSIAADVKVLKPLPAFTLRFAAPVVPAARLAGTLVANRRGIPVSALVLHELLALPARAPSDGPMMATRGKWIELAVSGLPVDFGGRDKIAVVGAKAIDVPAARLACILVANPRGVPMTALVAYELLSLPARAPNDGPRMVTRGEKIELAVSGLPVDFGGHNTLAVVGAKATASPGGKGPILVEGLTPGKYTLKAKFPGDDTYAAGESNAVEVRVRRKPVLEFEPMSRDEFSRGKVNLRAKVKGDDKGDPVPKGTLQLKSSDQVLAEGSLDAKGGVDFRKDSLAPGPYDLRLHFTPDDKGEWSAGEQPLPGPWSVVQTAVLPIDLDEKGTKEQRELGIRFKASAGNSECKELPPGRRFFLRFRPGASAVTGAFEPSFELSRDTGNPRLVVRWRPGKDSWGMAKAVPKAPAFQVITVVVADTAEKLGKVRFDKAVEYALNNDFRPTQGNDFVAFRPLVPEFRRVMNSLQGAEIEVYEGVDKKEPVKDAKGKETEKITRVRKDPTALPLLRLKLLDRP